MADGDRDEKQRALDLFDDIHRTEDHDGGPCDCQPPF